MKEFHQQTKEELLQQFHVAEHGLSGEETKKRLVEYGESALEEGKRKSTLQVFSEQFCDLLVVTLITAVLISMVPDDVESTIAITAVIILNATLGTVQHAKAEKLLDSSKSLSSPNAKVLRDGQKIEIPSAQVVPGDILYLETGDLVVADGRVLENYFLQVNESSLTGESTSVDKSDGLIHDDYTLADHADTVYSSGPVAYGRAVAFVTSTGMGTGTGKIAALTNATEEKRTPLQISLDQFGSRLTMGITVICGPVFLLSLYRDMPVLNPLMSAAALAVATIPETLSSIVTIMQAMGTQKMAKEHAITRELRTVGSLGCVSAICSDKTGMLTQDRITVQNIYINQEIISIDRLNLHSQLYRYLLYDAILTSDSSIMNGKGTGDPTESVPVEMGRKATVDENLLRELMPHLKEIPFDSDRKLMSTRYELHDTPTILTKGALDVLLDRIVKIRTESGIRDVTQRDRDTTLQKNLELSQEGLRVLAFGYKEVPENYTLSLDNESDFTFLGLISMMDLPKGEPKAAVAGARRAGIEPVMITEDHEITATAIAKQIGVFKGDDITMTGRELDAVTEEELDRSITNIPVYARVSPENKIRIVDVWQKRGSITAMTGDRANDAPAPKKADIGAAMGTTGMEVSKDAAAMILTDDNFAITTKAVANGRNAYRNIKNAIKFLLSGNMTGILSVLYTLLITLPVPFTPVYLLFTNLLTDSLPAIAIGMEPAEKDLLVEAPRNPKTGILTKDFVLTILTRGGVIAVCTMIVFHMGLSGGGTGIASTMASFALTLAHLFHGFSCRSKHNILRLGFSSNQYNLGAFTAGVCLLGLVIFVPLLQKLFSVTPLSSAQMGGICLLIVIPTVIIRVSKILRDLSHKN